MCRRGDFVHCSDQPILGDGQQGGYAEYVIVRASGLVAVPENVPAAELAPLMCAGLTVHHALRESAARAGDLVAVQGIGGLGHLGIQYARAVGFRVVAIAREHGVQAMIETVPFERAGGAYAKMMAGDARFRMVLDVAGGGVGA